MNRIVIITGASTGLGLSLARLFAASGDVVYGTSRTKTNWKSAKRALPSENFYLEQVDGTSESKVKRFINKIKKHEKQIDILINNAGYVSPLARLENERLREFTDNLSNNLITAFLMSKYTIPLMRRRKNGLIFNISSMAGFRAVPRLSAYSASKFGQRALTEAIAKENFDAGIKCVTVCPGGMNTRMRAKVFGRQDAAAQQSADFVAGKIFEIAEDRLKVKTGEAILIRHGKITAIHPLPEA